MNTNNIQKVNYQKILDKITDKIEKECAEGENRPALFLHACCAPCSSYVLECYSLFYKCSLVNPDNLFEFRLKSLKPISLLTFASRFFFLLHSLTSQSFVIILFPCAEYGYGRTYNISLFQDAQDDSFSPWSYCSYAACTPYMPM